MSAISTAYDQFYTVVTGILPNHVELLNAYVPELNDDLTFAAGFGIAMGGGKNTNREICNFLSIERELIVTITRRVYKGDLMRTSDAVSARRTAEKQLFEDQKLVIEAIMESANLSSTSPVANTVYAEDSGLEFVRTENVELLMVKTVFKLEYIENLT